MGKNRDRRPQPAVDWKSQLGGLRRDLGKPTPSTQETAATLSAEQSHSAESLQRPQWLNVLDQNEEAWPLVGETWELVEGKPRQDNEDPNEYDPIEWPSNAEARFVRYPDTGYSFLFIKWEGGVASPAEYSEWGTHKEWKGGVWRSEQEALTAIQSFMESFDTEEDEPIPASPLSVRSDRAMTSEKIEQKENQWETLYIQTIDILKKQQEDARSHVDTVVRKGLRLLSRDETRHLETVEKRIQTTAIAAWLLCDYWPADVRPWGEKPFCPQNGAQGVFPNWKPVGAPEIPLPSMDPKEVAEQLEQHAQSLTRNLSSSRWPAEIPRRNLAAVEEYKGEGIHPFFKSSSSRMGQDWFAESGGRGKGDSKPLPEYWYSWKVLVLTDGRRIGEPPKEVFQGSSERIHLEQVVEDPTTPKNETTGYVQISWYHTKRHDAPSRELLLQKGDRIVTFTGENQDGFVRMMSIETEKWHPGDKRYSLRLDPDVQAWERVGDELRLSAKSNYPQYRFDASAIHTWDDVPEWLPIHIFERLVPDIAARLPEQGRARVIQREQVRTAQEKAQASLPESVPQPVERVRFRVTPRGGKRYSHRLLQVEGATLVKEEAFTRGQHGLYIELDVTPGSDWRVLVQPTLDDSDNGAPVWWGPHGEIND